jgi:type II secretory pathway component GspD/PulD (secretin)
VNPPIRSREGTYVNRSQVVTETGRPTVYAVLDQQHGAQLLELCQSDRSANVLQAPVIRVSNGQFAVASDCARTPFVVGIKDGNPQIRIVTDGTTLQVRPRLEPQGKPRLDFAILFSKINKVETVTAMNASRGAPATVQVPEIAIVRMEGSVELPWNQWLVLGGPVAREEKSAERQPESGLAMLVNQCLALGGLEPESSRLEAQPILLMLRMEKAAPTSAKQSTTTR